MDTPTTDSSAELAHIRWLCDLLEERGYDLHAIAHWMHPLEHGEYDRRYNA